MKRVYSTVVFVVELDVGRAIPRVGLTESTQRVPILLLMV